MRITTKINLIDLFYGIVDDDVLDLFSEEDEVEIEFVLTNYQKGMKGTRFDPTDAQEWDQSVDDECIIFLITIIVAMGEVFTKEMRSALIGRLSDWDISREVAECLEDE